MLNPIREKIAQYEATDDVHQHGLIREAANQYLKLFPNEVTPENGLEEGISLVRHLQSLSYLGSMREYEHEYALHNEILTLKVRIYKRCIPSSHNELRGLVEMFLGMKEDALK
ncbi:hypothetical protein N9355_09830 [Crocinitomicaceae bacterium]|nr:hypothetical protein [Crocinitomicaceae bacterium]